MHGDRRTGLCRLAWIPPSSRPCESIQTRDRGRQYVSDRPHASRANHDPPPSPYDPDCGRHDDHAAYLCRATDCACCGTSGVYSAAVSATDHACSACDAACFDGQRICLDFCDGEPYDQTLSVLTICDRFTIGAEINDASSCSTSTSLAPCRRWTSPMTLCMRQSRCALHMSSSSIFLSSSRTDSAPQSKSSTCLTSIAEEQRSLSKGDQCRSVCSQAHDRQRGMDWRNMVAEYMPAL